MADQVQEKLDELKAEVERGSTVRQSVTTYVEGILAQIEGAKDDPDQIQAVIDTVRSNNDSLAALVPANTAAAGEEQ